MARRFARLAAGVILAAVCWVAIGWRSVAPLPSETPNIVASPLDVRDKAHVGPFAITGAWRLTAEEPGFDSLSALAVEADGRFFAVSDRSRWYRFAKPGKTAPSQSGAVTITFPDVSQPMGDSESLVTDWERGFWWTTLENYKAIIRYDRAGGDKFVREPMMADWPANEGPEAMVRLTDGRFVILAEWVSPGRDKTHPALLYAGDPIETGEPLPFHFAMPGGTVPVEATLLPDGRVLILGRDFNPLFGFTTNLAIADPAEIRPGSVWQARELGRLQETGLRDNYEGMAVEQDASGKITVWLVSDDNQAKLLQRTILLRLETQKSALR